MPALLKLNEFGGVVAGAFGIVPCLVGSALLRKDWRDVDVRLMLPNDVYCHVFDLDLEGYRADWKSGKLKLDGERDLQAHAAHMHHNKGTYSCPRWVAYVRAFAALGVEMTGLPIDFQISSQYVADLLHPATENHRYRLWSVAQRAHVAAIQ